MGGHTKEERKKTIDEPTLFMHPSKTPTFAQSFRSLSLNRQTNHVPFGSS
jgi:hypothetical protein